jgi:TRAP-type C4-dicarboxylate transport system permease small subunit
MFQLDRTKTIAVVMSWIGGALILASAILVTLDLVLRHLVNVTFGGIDDISGFAYAVAGSWAMSHALFKKVHVRVDSLYSYFPTRIRPVIDIVAIAALTIVMAVVTFHGFQTLQDSIRSGTRTISAMSFPLAVPQAAWVFGLAFFVICLLQTLLVSVRRLIQGDTDAVSALIGPLTGAGEVAQEQEMLRRDAERNSQEAQS